MSGLGAIPVDGGRCRFELWAPRATRVQVVLLNPERSCSLDRGEDGYFLGTVEGVPPGTRYGYRLDGGPLRPDPASRLQEATVHGPSVVFDPRPLQRDRPAWKGRALEESVFYEVHTGTFTPAGTLDAAISRLHDLAGLGVTAVELMPLAQFPGDRNWGYDGVLPFAVQNSYGGPAALFRFVDACHREGLSVFLDVVYNHLGPEGNYLAEFGPYFSERYRTPWGAALNFDGAGSDEVRRYFVENARWWLEEVGIDGLRLDAVHAILDTSAHSFLAELAESVSRWSRRIGHPGRLVAECDRNDPKLVRTVAAGGLGIDAQWNDDFHHALHVSLTGEREGYYVDFAGVADLVTAYNEGFVLSGRRSTYRGRRHGSSAADIPPGRFVVYSQNHDQVGNRRVGDRLSTLATFEDLKLAAGAVLLSPFLPLLFMGEEYGEVSPFLYFVSHGDPDLAEAVRTGRAAEFAAFGWEGEVPDPQSEGTFRRSKLAEESRRSDDQWALKAWYERLLQIRTGSPSLGVEGRDGFTALSDAGGEAVILQRNRPPVRSRVVLHFGRNEGRVCLGKGTWLRVADSAEPRWKGPGTPTPERIEAVAARSPSPVAPRSCTVWFEEESR